MSIDESVALLASRAGGWSVLVAGVTVGDTAGVAHASSSGEGREGRGTGGTDGGCRLACLTRILAGDAGIAGGVEGVADCALGAHIVT